MTHFPFRPTQQDLDRIGRDVGAIPEVQESFLDNDVHHLKVKDRIAHQYQISGGRVVLRIASELPENLQGLALFEPNSEFTGIGRISTGLGYPHKEGQPDFLGLMLAFQTRRGHRVDFLGINNPTAPTDTHVEFMKLLTASAAGAGTGLATSSFKVFNSLRHDLGLRRGIRIFSHVLGQTLPTALSRTAFQTYWTGIVEIGGVFGKFVLEPISDGKRLNFWGRRALHLTQEWHSRQTRGPVEFHLHWIPFIDEQATSRIRLTKKWKEQRHTVGTVTFPQCDFANEDTRLWAALAAEIGANPGNWVHDLKNTIPEPSTEFGVARKIAYQKSQRGRNALPEIEYASVFQTGVIDSQLAEELNRRRSQKRDLGHIDAALEEP